MNKIVLPLVVVAASAAYVVSQQGQPPGGGTLDASLLGAAGIPDTPRAAETTASRLPAPAPAKASAAVSGASAAPPAAGKPADASASVVAAHSTPPDAAAATGVVQADAAPTSPAPSPTRTTAAAAGVVVLPRPRPAPPVALQVADAAPVASSGLRDGTYTGPAANAYYGRVQVQAVIQGGQLVEVKILQYPSDRRTSRYINGEALPMLQQEAIAAQSAQVDFISGATLSSGAFVRSLAGALGQATG